MFELNHTLQPKYQRLTGQVGDVTKSWSSTFSYTPPEGDLKSSRGSLYAVIDLNSSKSLDLALAGKLVFDALSDGYYQEGEGSPLRALETTLIEGKERLVALAYGESFSSNSPEIDLNIVVVTLVGNIMYLARLGEGVSFLVRDGKVEEVGGGYESVVTVASGIVKSGDLFVLGSKAFSQMIPAEKLLSFLPNLQNTIQELNDSVESSGMRVGNAFPLNFSVILLEFPQEVGPAEDDLESPVVVAKKEERPKKFSRLAKSLEKLKPKPSPIYVRKEVHKLDELKPHSSRFFLMGMGLLVSLFVLSVVFTINKKRSSAHSAQVVELMKKANDDVAKARELTDLNNARAREYVRSAEDVLKEAKALAGGSSGDISKLEKDISQVWDQVNKVVKINEPEVYYDLKAQGEDVAPTSLTGGSDSLYVADGKEKAVFRLRGLEEKGVPQVERMGGDLLSNVSTLLPGSGRLFALSLEGVVILTLGDGSTSRVEFSLPVSFSSVKTADVYIDALYFLSPENNQIYRTYISGEDFGEAVSWIGGNVNLSDAVSFTIDGDIYVVRAGSGELMKLANGVSVEWKIREMDKPLNKPTDVYTTVDSNFLYIADAGNRRVVVVAKEGGLYNRQFVYSGGDEKVWQTMQDLYVDESESIIYLLDGTKIYKIQY